MERLRFGVLGCSEFAGRAMIPAIKDTPEIELKAVASRELAKARGFADRFGCDAVGGYGRLLEREDIDAVYVPLPPGLHEEWVLRSLDAGKHVLVEKPFAGTAEIGVALVRRAKEQKLLILENFLFLHHSQFAWVRDCLAKGTLGELRLLRTTFTIPPLKPDNFRYQSALGGGALLDLAPYVVRFARVFLGEPITLMGAIIREDPVRRVDVSGTAQFVNKSGLVAQVAYGFDTHYQCFWEFLGTQAKLVVERGYTPPPGFTPVVRIESQGRREEIVLPADNHYRNMCRHFARTVIEGGGFETQLSDLASQARCLCEMRTHAALS
jgi:predicted dehydrogenase